MDLCFDPGYQTHLQWLIVKNPLWFPILCSSGLLGVSQPTLGLWFQGPLAHSAERTHTVVQAKDMWGSFHVYQAMKQPCCL